jgi:hypothetical protein
MSPTELAIAALATWQAVEVWRHSELLAGLRARSELYDNIITRALACPFCLSVWVALMVVGLLLLPCPAWQNPGPGLWPTLRAEPVFGEHSRRYSPSWPTSLFWPRTRCSWLERSRSTPSQSPAWPTSGTT